MSGFCVQDALDIIDKEWVDIAAPLVRRRYKADRTKARIYEVIASAKQFAVMVGDKNESTQRFDGDEVKVVLEVDAPRTLIGVTRLDGHMQYQSSALNQPRWSRLKAGQQHRGGRAKLNTAESG